ncbi:MAG: SurA N-terminal domain-containing protein [Terrimicrobiaceae bacterium]|nr:SurA N-terminal domain-containing protein [Terrimicrobiaceae bacterium]
MFTWMRTHQRNLMLVITILTIISFVFFYSITDRTHQGSGQVARVYGRNLSVTDFQREARKFQLALALGLTEYATSLGGNGADEGLSDFVINKLIIDHEGLRLGIQPGDEDVKNAITALPVFQTGGQFDPLKYRQLVVTALTPQGFTELEIQNLVRSSLILERIKQMLDSVPAVTDGEIAYYSRMFQPTSGVAVLFDLADFARQVKLTEDQITAAFKADPKRFVTSELRTARYVRFPMPADAQKLDGKAKIDAQQKVADASDNFATHAAGAGLQKAAAEAGLKVETTLPFDANGKIPALAELGSAVAVGGPATAIAPAAFTLTEKAPVTGVLQNGDEFVVAELMTVTPSRPMTLAEARPEITRELTDTAAKAALEKAATGAVAKLREAARAGQPASQAAAAAGLKTQVFTNVLLSDEAAPVDLRRFAAAARSANEGEITGLHAEPTGGFLVWLEKRGPADPKAIDQHRADLVADALAQQQNLLWTEWLKSAQREAGVAFPSGNRG